MAMKHSVDVDPALWRRRSLFLVAALVVLASLLLLLPPVHGQSAAASAPALACGNGVLDPGESCRSCAADAGVCAPFSVLCAAGNVCLAPPAPCPNVKPCRPVPPAVLADAKLVVTSLRGSLVRQAARRVFAALRAMDAYCPGTPSTGQLTLVLTSAPDVE